MNGFHPFTAAGVGEFELRRAGDFQAVLLGMAGADLRQPLQVVQSAYEWLGSRIEVASANMRRERCERAIAKLTEQLDRLLGALRLYEQTRSIQGSPVALAPLISDIPAENAKAAANRGVELRACNTTAEVVSNPVLLHVILRNLVRKAVNYADPGSRILIGCRRCTQDVRVDIYGTGLGVAPGHLPGIFDAFERLDSTRVDGLGIGLLVVRRALEQLGHRIEVASAPSQGVRFSLFARAASYHCHNSGAACTS